MNPHYLESIVSKLPERKSKHVVVLSGGLDSTVLTALLVRHYGPSNLFAITFDYGQRQQREIECARGLTSKLGISHQVISLRHLGDVVRSASSNIMGSTINVPHSSEVIGNPQPVTYVPFRNLNLLAVALSYAETMGAEFVYTGIQAHDDYGYWDATQSFIDALNQVTRLNRKTSISVLAPFAKLSKYEEILIAQEIGALALLKHSLTCYQPNDLGQSCGNCPSCGERISNFARARIEDQIPYQRPLDWSDLFAKNVSNITTSR